MLIIASFLISSSLVAPKYNEINKLQKDLHKEKAKLAKATGQLSAIRGLQIYNFYINNRNDTLLLVKHLARQKGARVVFDSEGVGVFGQYMVFNITFDNYTSLANVINSFSQMRTLMPIAYTRYEMTSRNIKVRAVVYFKESHETAW